MTNEQKGGLPPVGYRAMTRRWETAQDEEWVYGPWTPGLASNPRFEHRSAQPLAETA